MIYKVNWHQTMKVQCLGEITDVHRDYTIYTVTTVCEKSP